MTFTPYIQQKIFYPLFFVAQSSVNTPSFFITKFTDQKRLCLTAKLKKRLVCTLLMFILSPLLHADILLNSDTVNDWQKDCRRCSVDIEFDVNEGEVIQLNTKFGYARLKQPFVIAGDLPMAEWRWVVDEGSEQGVQIYLRVDFQAKRLQQGDDLRNTAIEQNSKDTLAIYYVWDKSAAFGAAYRKQGRHFIVVSGDRTDFGKWQSAERSLTSDIDLLTSTSGVYLPSSFQFGLGDPEQQKFVGKAYIKGLSVRYPSGVQQDPNEISSDIPVTATNE
ncbi:MAG: DUF3047 domain-containing protein [Oleibacter sp.]|nr:DUF3047 domain-containing protein [Thalassolituus sp.]